MKRGLSLMPLLWPWSARPGEISLARAEAPLCFSGRAPYKAPKKGSFEPLASWQWWLNGDRTQTPPIKGFPTCDITSLVLCTTHPVWSSSSHHSKNFGKVSLPTYVNSNPNAPHITTTINEEAAIETCTRPTPRAS
eukprot:4283645-Amphidinium_carterae.1